MTKVTSKDGTQIAYTLSGNGPAVILVDGAMCSRAFGPMPKLATLLASHFTVINYDRRGRNESGNTEPYSVDREIEDIEALIYEAGGSAYLAGCSSGAALALKAAAASPNIKKLALYEAPYLSGQGGHVPPKDTLEQLKRLVAAGKKSGAVKYFIHDMVGMPAFVTFIMPLMPAWGKLKSVAHTLPYDAAIMGDFKIPVQVANSVKIQSLVMAGGKSPASMQNTEKKLAEAIPGAQYHIIEGQTHNISEKALAPELIKFFKS